MSFRTAYSGKPSRTLGSTTIVGPSRTKESFGPLSDINNIMKKYTYNDMRRLAALKAQDARYGDFSDVPSYQDSLNRVIFAQEQFNALPSNIRKRFDNDPIQFLAFATDPKNVDELVTMGIVKKPAPTTTSPPPSQPSPPAGAGSQPAAPGGASAAGGAPLTT